MVSSRTRDTHKKNRSTSLTHTPPPKRPVLDDPRHLLLIPAGILADMCHSKGHMVLLRANTSTKQYTYVNENGALVSTDHVLLSPCAETEEMRANLVAAAIAEYEDHRKVALRTFRKEYALTANTGNGSFC